jgi:hypothetical protein
MGAMHLFLIMVLSHKILFAQRFSEKLVSSLFRLNSSSKQNVDDEDIPQPGIETSLLGLTNSLSLSSITPFEREGQ